MSIKLKSKVYTLITGTLDDVPIKFYSDKGESKAVDDFLYLFPTAYLMNIESVYRELDISSVRNKFTMIHLD